MLLEWSPKRFESNNNGKGGKKKSLSNFGKMEIEPPFVLNTNKRGRCHLTLLWSLFVAAKGETVPEPRESHPPDTTKRKGGSLVPEERMM